VTGRADNDQVGVLLLGLLVKATTGARGLDRDELGCDVRRGALFLKQLVGALELLSDEAAADPRGPCLVSGRSRQAAELTVRGD
jgi:hypothetical protein